MSAALQSSFSRRREHGVFRIMKWNISFERCRFVVFDLAFGVGENAILADTAQSDVLRHSGPKRADELHFSSGKLLRALEDLNFKGHSELRISSDPGIRDPRFENLRIEIVRSDRSPRQTRARHQAWRFQLEPSVLSEWHGSLGEEMCRNFLRSELGVRETAVLSHSSRGTGPCTAVERRHGLILSTPTWLADPPFRLADLRAREASLWNAQHANGKTIQLWAKHAIFARTLGLQKTWCRQSLIRLFSHLVMTMVKDPYTNRKSRALQVLQHLSHFFDTGVCEKTFILRRPLPCNPAAETAPKPLIWCSGSLYSKGYTQSAY